MKSRRKLLIPIIAGLILSLCFWSIYSNKRSRPNILFVTIDALRPDHLGCYGYRRDTSPFIDNLTKEGILFTQAISQGPTTLVSIASLLTSAYPIKHGIIDQIADCHKELVNLYNEEKEIVAKLKKEMDSLLKDYSYNETNSENIDNNTKKEMRSLGYIQ